MVSSESIELTSVYGLHCSV